MDLETVIKSTDEEILAFMHEIPPKPFPGAHHPEKSLYIPTSLLMKFFKNNYRTHTFKFTDELGDSIKEYGQLEPILLTKNGDIVDTDGRGRFWSNFFKGADYMPVEILYNVPELLKLQMEIDLNVTKTKIDNEDIAKLANDIFTGLVKEYSIRQPDGKSILHLPNAKKNALKLTADVMCRNKETVRRYLAVSNLDSRILEDNKKRRSAQSFTRLHAIAKTFTEQEDQWNFYNLMRIKEDDFKQVKIDLVKRLNSNGKQKQKLKKLETQETVLNKNQFYGLLTIYKEEKDQQSFLLAQKQCAQPITKNYAYQMIQKTKQYLFGARQLIRRFPELKEGLQKHDVDGEDLNSFFESSANTLLSYIDQGAPSSKRAVDKYFERNKEETFEEGIKKRTKKKNGAEPIIVRSIGEKPVYIPLEQIIIDDEQVRSKYNKDSIHLLAKKIADYGQVKPGVVIPIGRKNGKTLYKVVVGNSRYQGCVIAKTGFFKTYVRKDLKDYETKIIQAIEDMFEQDTHLERSAMLNRMYDLAKKRAAVQNETISLDDFLSENRHLGPPGKLKNTMSLLDLPKTYQDMIKARLITPDGALAINSLPEKYHIQFLFPLMTDPQYKRVLKKNVNSKKNELDLEQKGITQLKTFQMDDLISYKGFYEELTNQLQSVSQIYRRAQGNSSMAKRIKENVAFNLALAKTYEEIKIFQKELNKSQKMIA